MFRSSQAGPLSGMIALKTEDLTVLDLMSVLEFPSREDDGANWTRKLPMNWLEPSDDRRVVVAVSRIRATDKSNYKGPVFFNPGDLISFDPRGIHQTGYDKLKYWGFSYGTIIGGVFASMYPDKVERMVNDGNVDLREWFNSQHINFLRDTDKVLYAFYEFCYQAGPDRCAFYATSSQAIEERFNKLLSDIKALPIVINADEETGPDVPSVVTYSKVKILLSSVLYEPQYQFENFAKILAALERRDGRPYYEHYNPNKPSTAPLCAPRPVSPFEPFPEILDGTPDAFPVIMCADHPPVHNLTLEEVKRQSEELIGLSPATGSINVPFPITCNQRNIRPQWRFDGPFEGKTKHPILFIANKFDNITPLVSARNNSAGFPGSTVLVQNSYGDEQHTTLAAPSKCTKNYIKAYFQNGTLPDAGAECEGDSYPFAEPVGTEMRMFHPTLHL
ncbi:putative hydrolase [Colletotrichum sp. SAR11_240]|nr:putative hydrolase [Colletotrichum sp. SAR11_240]